MSGVFPGFSGGSCTCSVSILSGQPMVVDRSRCPIHGPHTMSPGWKECPFCLGSGMVQVDDPRDEPESPLRPWRGSGASA